MEKIDNANKDLNEEEKKQKEQETVIDSITKNVVVETKETNDDVPIPWENWDGPKEPKEMIETV